jgi:hypothetical protein
MASTRYYGQWRVGFVVRTEFNNWRRARVQDNRTSWISRSPIFVNSRSWRGDCSFPTSPTNPSRSSPGMSALMAAVRRATERLSLRERPSEPQLRLQLATEKHRLTRSCAWLLFLQPWLSNPRTRSPLPGRRRFWHRFIRDIRVVRCRTGSPSACRRCLKFLNRVYRLRWCCW